MTIQSLIEKVIIKMDEVSPFEEPLSLVALDNPDEHSIHPVRRYIAAELPTAAVYCLSVLPLHLVASDVESVVYTDVAIINGVATVPFECGMYYPKRVSAIGWNRPVTAFFNSSDQLYTLQLNAHTRGGEHKPAVAIVPECKTLELYSWKHAKKTEVTVWWVNTGKAIESDSEHDGIKSPIEDYIALRCAEQVFGIMQNANGVSAMQKVFNEKLQQTS